ncbi:hypothetical protein Syun_026470 [Stephania yunnanensis]|uniref:Enolase N-terminal domain-containing protein n=1 Tax=Stephania yunnanensis TaxID=152371 RepID=A0AAP0EWA2_9MAGN
MSSSSRAVTTLLDGDWRASLGDLVLFKEIWKWGFGFGGFWRWCSEFELLSTGARAFSRRHRIRPRRLALSSLVVLAVVVCSVFFVDAADQTAIDNYMIYAATRWNCQRLGANVILTVSLAVCKAGASVKKVPLYKFCNVCILLVSVEDFDSTLEMRVQIDEIYSVSKIVVADSISNENVFLLLIRDGI